MKSTSQALIQDLTKRTQDIIHHVNSHFIDLNYAQLNWTSDKKSWSILQCLEHLNLYGDFYIPEMSQAVEENPNSIPIEQFESSWLGEYFANAMLPTKSGQIKKMKTFKSKEPTSSQLDKSIINRFLKQQEAMLSILKKANDVNLRKIKCSTTIGKLVRVNLGDVMRVVVYHNERHIKQANRCLSDQS